MIEYYKNFSEGIQQKLAKSQTKSFVLLIILESSRMLKIEHLFSLQPKTYFMIQQYSERERVFQE